MPKSPLEKRKKKNELLKPYLPSHPKLPTIHIHTLHIKKKNYSANPKIAKTYSRYVYLHAQPP